MSARRGRKEGIALDLVAVLGVLGVFGVPIAGIVCWAAVKISQTRAEQGERMANLESLTEQAFLDLGRNEGTDLHARMDLLESKLDRVIAAVEPGNDTPATQARRLDPITDQVEPPTQELELES